MLIAANIALVIVTLLYLLETRHIRLATENSFRRQATPKPFVEQLDCTPRLQYNTKSIQIAPVFTISNGGGAEACNVVIEYTLSSGDMRIEKATSTMQYLFPGQKAKFKMKLLNVRLDDSDYEIAKQAVDTAASLLIPKGFVPTIAVSLTLKYTDTAGEKHALPYSFEYILHDNAWVYPDVSAE